MAKQRYNIRFAYSRYPYNGTVLCHPDFIFKPQDLEWYKDGDHTSTCLNIFGNRPFSSGAKFYVGDGYPDAVSFGSNQKAMSLVGMGISYVYNETLFTLNCGTISESGIFTEYDRSLAVNHAGWGLVGYGAADPDYAAVDPDYAAYAAADAEPTHGSATWKYAPNAGKCPSGVSASPKVSAAAVASTGSVFHGFWSGGERISESLTADIDGNRDIADIVAVFGLPFSVVFDPNGGNGSMDGVSRTLVDGGYVAQDPLPECAYTLSGKLFAGWNTAADGTGTTIPDGAEIESAFGGLVETGGQSVTLYAQWRDPSILVTKVNLDADGPSVNGVGTISLYSSDDGFASPVAVEENGILRFDGVSGKRYRVMCKMGGEQSADFLWDALGVGSGSLYASVVDIDFTRGVKERSLEYVFSRKPFYALTVVSTHGSVSITPDADSDGRYVRGRTIRLSITPDAGWSASQVSYLNSDTGDVYVGTVKDNAVTIDGISFNIRMVVDYSQISHSLAAMVDNASSDAISSVSVKVGGVDAETAHHGDTAVFSATVADGYAFAGWYAQDGSLVSESVNYSVAVSSDLSLVAKAKVSVSFDIEYSGDGEHSCALSVNGAAYTTGQALYVILGNSIEYGVTLGKRTSDAMWKFDCWLDGEAVTSMPMNGTFAPTASATLTARVAASVSRTLEVFLAHMGTDTSNLEDASGLPGAITCVDANPEPFPTGTGGEKPFKFLFEGAKSVRINAAEELTFTTGNATASFYCFSTEAPGGQGIMPSEASILSFEPGMTLFLNVPKKTIYAYYGVPAAVVVSLAYAAHSDATMGSIAFTGTDPSDDAAEIGVDGTTVTATQGKSVTMRATSANGYRFAGWFLSSAALGDPAWTGAEEEIRVTAQRTIYAKFVKDTHSICEWEGEQSPKTMVWRSKTYAASRPFNPSVCRVDALGYAGDGRGTQLELTVDMFSAPDAAATVTSRLTNISDQDARRLPSARPERYAQVEVSANVEVDAVLVGTSMGGIAV